MERERPLWQHKTRLFFFSFSNFFDIDWQASQQRPWSEANAVWFDNTGQFAGWICPHLRTNFQTNNLEDHSENHFGKEEWPWVDNLVWTPLRCSTHLCRQPLHVGVDLVQDVVALLEQCVLRTHEGQHLPDTQGHTRTHLTPAHLQAVHKSGYNVRRGRFIWVNWLRPGSQTSFWPEARWSGKKRGRLRLLLCHWIPILKHQ